MSDPQRLPHERIAYERPNLPYRCGRAAIWGTPCWQGPDLAGRCGGSAQCVPSRKGDRWECRRPSHGGGPCEHGPLPDGSCCQVRPPCQPRLQLRRWRGRLAVVAMVTIIAVIGAFSSTAPDSLTGPAAMDAGPLSSPHAGFIGPQRCEACHSGHVDGGIAWLLEVFEPHDNDTRCLECHAFAGPARKPHNRDHAGRPELIQPGCGACHEEHQGAKHDLSAVHDQVCSNCHERPFKSYADDHPEFSSSYPSRAPDGIYYDHPRHLGQYFAKVAKENSGSKAADFARRAGAACTTCHALEVQSREVTPLPFEATCAVCHGAEVAERPLKLLGAEDPTPISALLLGMDIDDDDLPDRHIELRDALAEQGMAALAPLLQAWDQAAADGLVAGLSSELVQTAARAWIEQDGEYETPDAGDIKLSGWVAGFTEDGEQYLRYRAVAHRDPLLKTWMDAVTRAASDQSDAGRREVATAALEWLLDPGEGPGACGKCHIGGVDLRADARRPAPQGIAWGRARVEDRKHVYYAHAPHLELLGRGNSCRGCHRLNESADYGAYFEGLERDPAKFTPSFSPISKSACDGCHKPDKVRFNCQLCHNYHRGPTFNLNRATNPMASRSAP